MNWKGVGKMATENKLCYWLVTSVVLMLCTSCQRPFTSAKWKPAKGPLMTQWAKDVSPDNVHPDYPRPQMTRENWKNLNGLWQYAIKTKDEPKPKTFDGQILVPFPVESALSGVMKRVGEENRLWYQRTFEVPDEWANQRVLLHFGAVDWETTVRVNGKEVGTHRGGYDPFTFDITEALNDTGSQQIVLSVWDPTDKGDQPRGKQVRRPRGIWYSPVTGIWQTVWLEPVNRQYIKSLKLVTDIDAEVVRVTASCSNAVAGSRIQIEAKAPGFSTGTVLAEADKEIILPINNPKLWSPDSPFLYDLKVTLKDSQGKKIDTVRSYFGMRKISLGKDKVGITRIFLNNKVLSQYGPLDQGWWPDGLYIAPTDEALRYDIEVTKKLGCNMARKHVKVEPARWYYWCDRLGLLVWQDMPSGDDYIDVEEPDIKRSSESASQFELELKRIIDAFGNSPAIVMWVAFNEGWGQYDTPRITKLIKEYDPTRLVDNASGWADRGVGDVYDKHDYPGPSMPEPEEKRAVVLGEFGGLGRPIEGHSWQDKGLWGHHGTVKTEEQMTDAYLRLLTKLQPLIKAGLSAAVYTQTTDVEVEVNGLMTYDRAMIKMDAEKITAANKRLYLLTP